MRALGRSSAGLRRCAAPVTAARGEGRRPAVRGAGRRPQACAPWGCNRACFATAFGDAQGVGSFAATIVRRGSPPSGRAWKGVAKRARSAQGLRAGNRRRQRSGERPARRHTPFPRCGSKRTQRRTRGADDASACSAAIRSPSSRSARSVARSRRSKGSKVDAAVLVAPRARDRAVDEEGRSPTAACGRGTRGRGSARAGRSRGGRGRAGSRPRSRAGGRAPASRDRAAARAAGRPAPRRPRSAKRRRRRRSSAGATVRRRDARPVGDLGRAWPGRSRRGSAARRGRRRRRGRARAARASPRRARRGPRGGAPTCPTAARARCAASGRSPAACGLPTSCSISRAPQRGARRAAGAAVRAAALMSRAPRPSRLAFSHQSRRGRSTASASGQ